MKSSMLAMLTIGREVITCLMRTLRHHSCSKGYDESILGFNTSFS